MSIEFQILPWVRQHAAAAITALDGSAVDARFATTLVVTPKALDGNDGPQAVANQPAQIKLRWYGPGDVTGFDPREVIRTEPVGRCSDFEPNYFAHVEFDRPDFPWLFTPFNQAAAGPERLRPWICLIVVVRRSGVDLKVDPARPLPVLTIDDPSKELPDLAESWAWAHAAVSHAKGSADSLDSMLTDRPEHNLSRLICPRRLQPKTAYYACIVPTFDVGRRAGLGESVDELDADGKVELKPAWPSSWDAGTRDFKLPVYYHWEFMTSAAGDFEDLIWRLQRRSLDDPRIGTFEIDLSQAGYGLPAVSSSRAEGALRVTMPAAINVAEPFRTRLEQLVNDTAGPPVPGVPPPLYGCWHAAQLTLTQDSLPWLAKVNEEPRYRLAAGIGVGVVQKNQEQLMASAWQQVADVRRANQLVRQTQLAYAASARVHARHFAPMPAETMLSLTRPMHTRVFGLGSATVHGELAASRLHTATLSASFRRLARTRGPVAKRALSGQAPPAPGRQVPWSSKLIARINTTGKTAIAPAWGVPAGMVGADAQGAAAATPAAPGGGFALAGSMLSAQSGDIDQALARLGGADVNLRALAGAVKGQQIRFLRPPSIAPVAAQAQAAPLAQHLVKALDPEATLNALLESRLTIGAGFAGRQPGSFQEIMAAPEFPVPMYTYVAQGASQFMLPGLEHVPSNIVSGVQTNPAFVEAFLVGLNHEMSRELLWREYPTDQRGSYFRYFWDGGTQQDASPDVDPLHRWKGELGTHATKNVNPDHAVLLIRGDLLVRYPNAIVYAARAKWDNTRRELEPIPDDVSAADLKALELYPIFQGSLPPDIGFYGFGLTPADMRGSPVPQDSKPGWFFVLQEQPTEPRFGLNETKPPPEAITGTWDDLCWSDVHVDSAGYLRFAQPPATPPSKKPEWRPDTSTSATLAAILLRRPFRIAIPGGDLLPDSGASK